MEIDKIENLAKGLVGVGVAVGLTDFIMKKSKKIQKKIVIGNKSSSPMTSPLKKKGRVNYNWLLKGGIKK